MRDFLDRVQTLREWYRALRSLQRIMATMATLLLLVAASGCSGTEAVGPASRASVSIGNAAQHGVWYLRTRPCGTTRWGGELLRNQVIPVGGTQTLQLPAGCTAIRAETNRAVGGRMTWDSLDLQSGTTRTLTLDSWTYAN